MLFILKDFFTKRGIKLNGQSCIVVDVFAGRYFTAASMSDIEPEVDKNTLVIKEVWKLI